MFRVKVMATSEVFMWAECRRRGGGRILRPHIVNIHKTENGFGFNVLGQESHIASY